MFGGAHVKEGTLPLCCHKVCPKTTWKFSLLYLSSSLLLCLTLTQAELPLKVLETFAA